MAKPLVFIDMTELTPAQQKRKVRIAKLRRRMALCDKEIRACPHEVKHHEAGVPYDVEMCSICGIPLGLV